LELNDGRISAFTFAGGNGGNIDLQVGRLTLMAGSQIGSRADDIGQGGHVTIKAREIVLDADSEISARSQSESLRQFFSADPDVGKSGTITLTVGETIRLQNGGRITVETAQANAGDITLRGGSLLYLGNGGTITTSAAGGQGNGGDITIDADTIVLQDGQIRAEAFAGRGGNILITAEAFLADPASRVSASSALGLSGTVDIRAPATSVTGSLIPLPQDFLQLAALLPEPCATRVQSGKSSSFVLRGRDGLPLEPGGLLPSPLHMDERLMTGPAVSGEPAQQRTTARLALLDMDDKVLPRMGWAHQHGLSHTMLDLGCSK
jgi:large exoprotein involved in heme utilization and adhesion